MLVTHECRLAITLKRIFIFVGTAVVNILNEVKVNVCLFICHSNT